MQYTVQCPMCIVLLITNILVLSYVAVQVFLHTAGPGGDPATYDKEQICRGGHAPFPFTLFKKILRALSLFKEKQEGLRTIFPTSSIFP